jgi:glycosyltransferase involved in cell wall biosynthesis
MPKRFLIISSCPEIWGGSEELWWAAAIALRGRGHDVDVLRLIVDRVHPRIEALTARGCKVSALSRRGERLAVAASLLGPRRWWIDDRRYATLAAAAAIAWRRPNVVLVSQGQSYDGLPFAHASRVLRVPYVLVSQKASEAYWPRDAFRARARLAHTSAGASIFVSQHNQQVTEDQLGTIPQACVMRNPILVGRDGPLPWPEATGRAKLACVARLAPPEKGQDALLRALARERWRAREFDLTFFGTGGYRHGLETLAARLGLNGVSFAGQSTQIADAWRTHHLLVLPSRAEGLPLALVEAMMLGRPALVTDVGGNAEVVDDGVTGFIASGPEVEALDTALERAWTRRADWKTMGRRAAVHIREITSDRPADAGASLADLLESVAVPPPGGMVQPPE